MAAESSPITGPFDVEPILDDLAEQVLDVYLLLALRAPELTPGAFHTLALLLHCLRQRCGQEQGRAESACAWTPRRINDVRHLQRQGWIRAEASLADWYAQH